MPIQLASTSSEDTLSGTSNTNADNFPEESTLDLNHFSLYPPPIEKTAPTDLKEHINATTNAGAQLYVQTNEGTIVGQTNKFFLGAFSFGVKERTQLMETFSAPSIAFFGESVRIYNFSGTAVDYAGSKSPHFYQSSLIKMYNDMLRGTLLVERNQIAILTVLNHTIYGYPLNFQSNYSAQNDKIATFSMNWVITEHKLSLPGVVEEAQLKQQYTTNVLSQAYTDRTLIPLQEMLGLLKRFFNFNYWAEDAPDFAFLENRDWASITPYELQEAFGTKPSTFINELADKLETLKSALGDIAKSGSYSPILTSIFADVANPEQELVNAVESKFDTWIAKAKALWISGVLTSADLVNFKAALSELTMLYNKLLTLQRAKLAQASVAK